MGIRATMATPYALPEGLFYLDAAAAQRYAEVEGTEIVMSQHVNASVLETLDGWLQHIWLTGSGAEELTPGEGRAYVNHTRLIPSFKIEEQIQAAALASDEDAPGAVTTILYKVLKPGGFPIDDHMALVRFIPKDKGTEILWTIKLKLSATGSEAFPDPATLPVYLHKAAIAALARTAERIESANP